MLSKCLTPFFCSYTVCTPDQLFDAGMRKGTQAEKGAFQTVLLGESGYAGKIGNQLAICVIGFLQLSLSSLCKTDALIAFFSIKPSLISFCSIRLAAGSEMDSFLAISTQCRHSCS